MKLSDNIEKALNIIPSYLATHYNTGDEFDSVIMVDKGGSCVCRIYWFHDNNEEVLLDWLSVSEDSRNNGIGLVLQELRESIGIVLGAKRSVLWVDKSKWMKQWYERRGYKYHSDYKAETNAVWMKRELN